MTKHSVCIQLTSVIDWHFWLFVCFEYATLSSIFIIGLCHLSFLLVSIMHLKLWLNKNQQLLYNLFKFIFIQQDFVTIIYVILITVKWNINFIILQTDILKFNIVLILQFKVSINISDQSTRKMQFFSDFNSSIN